MTSQRGGTVAAFSSAVRCSRQSHAVLAASLLAMAVVAGAQPTTPDAADDSIRQFLAQDDAQPRYRGARRLMAENRNRQGWMEALTEYSPQTGFQYQITAEGGSSYIREKVLRAVLDGEREVIAQ